jgi:hypothetical protein
MVMVFTKEKSFTQYEQAANCIISALTFKNIIASVILSEIYRSLSFHHYFCLIIIVDIF